MFNWINNLKDDFIRVFIDGKRYNQMFTGFGNTLKITAGALLVGVLIGIFVAAVRSSYDKSSETLKKRGGFGYYIL